MIVAGKEKVERDFRVRMLTLREMELNYYVANAQQVATLSALFLGLSTTSLVDTCVQEFDLTDDRTYAFAELAQPISIVVNICICTFCCWGSMLVAMLAPRLALYGPPSQYSYLVDAVEEEFEYLMYGFVASAISFSLCALLWAWASLPLVAALTVTGLGLIALFCMRVAYVYTYERFQIPYGRKVTGRWHARRLSRQPPLSPAVTSAGVAGTGVGSLAGTQQDSGPWGRLRRVISTVSGSGDDSSVSERYERLEDVSETESTCSWQQQSELAQQQERGRRRRKPRDALRAGMHQKTAAQRGSTNGRRRKRSASLLHEYAEQAFAVESSAMQAVLSEDSARASGDAGDGPSPSGNVGLDQFIPLRTATGGWQCSMKIADCAAMPPGSSSSATDAAGDKGARACPNSSPMDESVCPEQPGPIDRTSSPAIVATMEDRATAVGMVAMATSTGGFQLQMPIDALLARHGVAPASRAGARSSSSPVTGAEKSSEPAKAAYSSEPPATSQPPHETEPAQTDAKLRAEVQQHGVLHRGEGSSQSSLLPSEPSHEEEAAADRAADAAVQLSSQSAIPSPSEVSRSKSDSYYPASSFATPAAAAPAPRRGRSAGSCASMASPASEPLMVARRTHTGGWSMLLEGSEPHPPPAAAA